MYASAIVTSQDIQCLVGKLTQTYPATIFGRMIQKQNSKFPFYMTNVYITDNQNTVKSVLSAIVQHFS